MDIVAKDVKSYQRKYDCSLTEAYRMLRLRQLYLEVNDAKTIEQLKPVLIGILNVLDTKGS